jgi:serine/threonine protein kinase/TPR repeat protein
MRRCVQCLSEIESKNATCSNCGLNNSRAKTINAAIPPGRVLDERYYLGGVLGQGGFGITYKGYDQDLDRVVAIKEYYPKEIVERDPNSHAVKTTNTASYKRGLQYFTEEARSLARFQGHANIVSVLSYFRANNTAYMVMEFMEGKTVRDILKGGKVMPVNDAVGIIYGILEGLKACHGTNLIHRDLTPDNVYITTTGQVKILDFGSARQTKDGEDNEFTQILKESYAPIEQYQKGGSQGPWTDIYSVGATFYRLLTGKPPNESAPGRLLSDNLKRPTELNPTLNLSEATEAVLMKAMSIKPEDRYQQVDSFKADLLNAMAGSAKASPKAQVSSQKPQVSSQEVKKPKIQEVKKVKKPEVSKQKSKTSQKIPEQKDSLKWAPWGIGVAAALTIVIGYQFYSPSSSAISNVAGGSSTGTGFVTPTPGPKPESKPQEKKPFTPSGKNFTLTVNTTPVNSRVRILGTKDIYKPGMVLEPSNYTAEVWSSGYRLHTQEINLTKNEVLNVNLLKLKQPSVKVLNDFYLLAKNPNRALYAAFKKNHKNFIPLASISNVKDISNSPVTTKAKNNDAESNFILGVFLSNEALKANKGWEKDIELSKKYLKASYNQGYLASGVWLSMVYSCFYADQGSSNCDESESDSYADELKNTVPLVNYVKAKLLYEGASNSKSIESLAVLASKKGVHFADHLLGEIAQDKRDMTSAIKYWTKSANKGNTKSMIRLASYEGNLSSSKRWLDKAYSEGDLEAGTLLAMRNPKIIPENFFFVASEAANSDVASGFFLTGWAYYNGIGTDQNNKKALENFKKCASEINCEVMHKILSSLNNNSLSPRQLEGQLESLNKPNTLSKVLPDVAGELYYQLGRSGLKDKQKNFAKAASFGSPKAISQLCNQFSYGASENSSSRNLIAFEYCSKSISVDKENTSALIFMGYCYEKGLKGCKKNKQLSISNYQNACNLNSGLACCSVARATRGSQKEEALVKARQNNFRHCDELLGIKK